MNTVIIAQARMGSTRLPGKVMMPLAGKPILARLLERLARVSSPHTTIVATTTSPADNILAEFCAEQQVSCYRGSEQDVLSRYFEAARHFGADLVVRVTSDCPLLDPAIVDQSIEAIISANGTVDYVSNMLPPTYPYGMAVEVFSMKALEQANREALLPAEREHVTPYIYWNPDRFRLHNMILAADLSRHRWTVDTPQDYQLVKQIFETLYPKHSNFTMYDIIELLDTHPHWSEINQDVQQVQPRSA